MNNFLLDLLPVFLFFLVFKYKGIYAATWVGILATLLQAGFYRLRHQRWDKMQLITLVIFIIFGGMTLYFRDPIFVKWKPTVIFWIFAAVLFASHFIGVKPMIHRLLESAGSQSQQGRVEIRIPSAVGKTLNMAWTLFFMVIGAINLYVAYHYNDAVWVNFKLYGITCATLLFSIGQTLFLVRYLKD